MHPRIPSVLDYHAPQKEGLAVPLSESGRSVKHLLSYRHIPYDKSNGAGTWHFSLPGSNRRWVHQKRASGHWNIVPGLRENDWFL